MPASLRCAAVIGAGACVSGSKPPPVFGERNHISKRMSPREQHAYPIPAKRDAPWVVARTLNCLPAGTRTSRSLPQLTSQESKTFCDVTSMDTDGSTADLVAVVLRGHRPMPRPSPGDWVKVSIHPELG